MLLTLSPLAGLARAQQPPPGLTTPQGGGGTPLFGLRPGLYGQTTLEEGHYQYAVNPGATVDDSVEVLNLSTNPLTLKLYGADLSQSERGAIAPIQPSDEQKGVGKWLALERTEVSLRGGQNTFIPFHVSVPTNLRPGDHLGAVVASTVTPPKEPGAFAVESRVALMVRVRIPGEAILDAEVGPLQVANAGGDRKFTVEVRNTGTLLFNVAGKVDIRSGENSVGTVDVGPEGVYIIPEGKARFEAVWKSTPLFGKRTAQAVLELTADEEPKKTVTSDALTLSFFSRLTVILAMLLLIGLVVWLIWRRRRQEADDSDSGYDTLSPPIEDRASRA